MGHGQGRGRHVVIGREDRRRPRAAGQQLFGGVQARAVGVETLLHAHRGGVDPGRGQGGHEALAAQLAAALVRIALDEAEAAMAQVQQVLGQFEGGGVIVDADAGQFAQRLAHGHRHRGDVGLTHLSQHLRRLAQGRGQDQPVAAVADQLVEGRHQRLVVHASLQHHLRAGQAALVQHADQELRQEPGRRVVIEQADPRRRRARQAARGRIGRIAQLANHLVDQVAGLRADIGFAIDHPRDRHGRDAGAGRHVANGRALGGLAPLPIPGFHLSSSGHAILPARANQKSPNPATVVRFPQLAALSGNRPIRLGQAPSAYRAVNLELDQHDSPKQRRFSFSGPVLHCPTPVLTPRWRRLFSSLNPSPG